LIPKKYEAILQNLNLTKIPIFALIEKKMDESITEIWQDIAGTSAYGQDAAFLDVPEGHPCLSIERRYFGRTGELFEVSYSIHPASTFSYSMRLHLGQR
jgi:DNA-binding GntR family transcriptional regulator